MRRFGLLALLLILVCGATVARADDFQLPGVSADADAYQATLTRRFPAGGTPQARRAAEQQATVAQQSKDWPGVVAALEQRVAQGEATAQQWTDLGTAFLRRTPPDNQKALLAGWQGFSNADAGDGEIPGLLVMAEALRALDRQAQAVQALEAVVERAPDNAAYKRQLADAQRATGVLVKRLHIEAEAEPPRACVRTGCGSIPLAPARR
jgi:thioredoxin-like negative regulator of GroEL